MDANRTQFEDRIAREAQGWERAAQREERNGNREVALTFRNMAWLLYHPEGWKQFVRELESKENAS